MSISRSIVSPSAAPHAPSQWLPLAGSVAKAAVEGMPSLAWAAGRRIAEWWAARRLAGYEDAFLKDIGIPRCGIEDAVRHGRADRHVKR